MEEKYDDMREHIAMRNADFTDEIRNEKRCRR